MVDTEKILITERQAAQLLGVGERTLFNLRQRRLIPHMKIGKSVRYSTASLRTWASEQERRMSAESTDNLSVESVGTSE